MANKLIIKLINTYQCFVSPFLGQCCRFYPSCSSYAKKAFLKLPVHKAFFMSIKRVIKCQPFSEGGVDDFESGVA